MAKAGGETITWILLSEAKARAVSIYQSREVAEERLTNWLAAGKLRWRSVEYPEGSKRDCDPGSGDPEFWVEPPLTFPPPGGPVIINPHSLIKNWDESWVRRRWAWASSYRFIRIGVAEEDLAKLLPGSPPRQEKTPKRKWRLDEVTPVVDEMFPGGVPKDKPTVELVRQLGNKLGQRGIRVSEATMERALGRRR